MQRMKCVIASALWLMIIACCQQTGNAFAEKASSVSKDDTMQFGLAISGGVSLGSYEAGLNWAFIKHLKHAAHHPKNDGNTGCINCTRRRPSLVAVAGASAGSINTLMSALSWCMSDSLLDDNEITTADSISRNIFRDSWLTIGIDQLLPDGTTDNPEFYNPDDLLFSRTAFDPILHNLNALLSARIYRADCDIPFAFTVTKVKPANIDAAGIPVENSRFVIPMRLVADMRNPGGVRVVSYDNTPYDPFWGNKIYLPGRIAGDEYDNTDGAILSSDYIVQNEDVLTAMLASSSFPIAFGSKEIGFCEHQTDGWNAPPCGADSVCPRGFSKTYGYFLDGGIFDNTPLGIVKAMAEPKHAERTSNTKISYVYLDPNKRRKKRAPDENSKGNALATSSTNSVEKLRPLQTELEFIYGAINTGMNYELYNVLRSDDWNHRADLLTERVIAQLIQHEKDRMSKKTDAGKPQLGSDIPDSLVIEVAAPFSPCGNIAATDTASASTESIKIAKIKNGLRSLARCLDSAYTYTFENGANPQRIRNELLHRLDKLASYMTTTSLQTALSHAGKDTGGDRSIVISSRYPRITGEFLQHFGAFLEDSFRRYDYYAGIYDAVNEIAKFRCKMDADDARCIGSQAQVIYDELGIEADNNGRMLFSHFACDEHPGCTDPQSSWYWVSQKKEAVIVKKMDEKVLIVDESLRQAFNSQEDINKAFAQFIKTLSRNHYPEAGPVLDEIMKKRGRDPLLWYYPITLRASLRLKQIADHEQAFPLLIDAGLLSVNSVIDDEQKIEWSRSTVPSDASWLWNVIPYEVSADIRNGGGIFAWEPRLNFSNIYSLNLKVTPWFEARFGENYRRFRQADIYFSWKRKGLLSSFGIGPSYYDAWQNYYNPNRLIEHVGAAIYFGMLTDKLRLTVGVRSMNDKYYPATGDNLYILFGITDLPGIVYWLQ